jgi:hypothetical protein
MQNLKKRGVMIIAVFVLGAVTALAAGPVGVSRSGTSKVAGIAGLSGGSGGTTFSTQCYSWKLGDQNQSGSTWVTSSNAYLYSGAGLQFTPNKHTAPADFNPGPDLAGVIGVGFANPAFIPTSVDVSYSFLPVARSASSTLSPEPTTIGLTWFNAFEAGNTFAPSEATVTTYPAFGQLSYTGFFPPVNNNTRYLVYIKTGDNGNPANNRGFAAAGAICFNP